MVGTVQGKKSEKKKKYLIHRGYWQHKWKNYKILHKNQYNPQECGVLRNMLNIMNIDNSCQWKMCVLDTSWKKDVIII